MQITAVLKLQVGLDGLTETPLAADMPALFEFLHTRLGPALQSLVQVGNGTDTVITAVKAVNFAAIPHVCTITEKAAAFLQPLAAQALEEIPELQSVVTLPIWFPESQPDQTSHQVVRPGTSRETQLVCRMRANEILAQFLRVQSELYFELIHGMHRELTALKEKQAQVVATTH